MPPSFITLKAADVSSQTLLPSLGAFIGLRYYEALAELRGSEAAEVADFFDMVYRPGLTIILSRD